MFDAFFSGRGFTRQPENSRRAHLFEGPGIQSHTPKFHETTPQEPSPFKIDRGKKEEKGGRGPKKEKNPKTTHTRGRGTPKPPTPENHPHPKTTHPRKPSTANWERRLGQKNSSTFPVWTKVRCFSCPKRNPQQANDEGSWYPHETRFGEGQGLTPTQTVLRSTFWGVRVHTIEPRSTVWGEGGGVSHTNVTPLSQTVERGSTVREL